LKPEIETRNQNSKSKSKLEIRNRNSKLTLEIEGRNQNSESKSEIEPRNQNSKSKSKLEIETQTQNSKFQIFFHPPVCSQPTAKVNQVSSRYYLYYLQKKIINRLKILIFPDFYNDRVDLSKATYTGQMFAQRDISPIVT